MKMVLSPSCESTQAPSRPTEDETYELRKIMTTQSQEYRAQDYKCSHTHKHTVEGREFKPSNSSHGSLKSTSSSIDSVSPVSRGLRDQISTPLDQIFHVPLCGSVTNENDTQFFTAPTNLHQNGLLGHSGIKNGLGPILSLLPENLLYYIISYIDYFERNPTMLLISHAMTNMLTRPDFLFELKHVHEKSGVKFECSCHLEKEQSRSHDKREILYEHFISNEFLIVVGGKCLVKTTNTNFSSSDYNREEIQLADASQLLEEDRLNHRIEMKHNDHCGIMAYDQRRMKWVRFGGNPMDPWIDRACHPRAKLHPLSPFGIVGSKPLYVGHPYYSLFFFGGTYYASGAPSSRVIAYCFLSGRWNCWADMMRARHGEDIVVARVEGANNTSSSLCSWNDSIVLIGCDLDFCDCYRCNSPPDSSEEDDCFIMNESCNDFEHQKRIYRKMAMTTAEFDTIGRCEVLNLTSQKWTLGRSRAPSCPPDDGGVAVIGGRYIYLPGTCPPPPTKETGLATAQSDPGRPGLRYDCWLDQWSTLPPRPFVTTSSPTTMTYNDRVIVLGGYRSSSESALSCYRHREEDYLLEYEDHLDYAWSYSSSPPTPENCRAENNYLQQSKEFDFHGTIDCGKWTFGGGTTKFGHTKAWAQSRGMAAALAAACTKESETSTGSQKNCPPFLPVPVRGAAATMYQGRLTVLGGLTTFSRTFYDCERKTIWQYWVESQEWRRASMELHVPGLLGGYAFSVHL